MSRPTITTLSGNNISIDLETRDFEGFSYDALELAETIAPDWTDRSEADVGVTIVEQCAFMADNLAYYQDRCANENLWNAATQRRSVIEQATLVGYSLQTTVSASVNLTFVCNDAGTVPAGTQIQSVPDDGSTPYTFELESDFVSTGAATYTTIVALEGKTTSEILGSSTGKTGQSFPITAYPIANNPAGTSSLKVYVAEGGPPVEWTLVDNFYDSTATDLHYRLEISEYDVGTIYFNDGVNGKIPSSGTDNITAEYRVGGGKEPNYVAADSITSLAGNYPFVDSVTNPAQPSGGLDKETIEDAKENAPQFVASNARCVTHADYEAHAKTVSGVVQAHAYQGDGSFEEKVVISTSGTNPVPTGTWDPQTETGSGLIGGVGTYLTTKKTAPVILTVLPVEVFDMHLSVIVYLYNNIRQSTADTAIREAVLAGLDPEIRKMGEQIPQSLVSDIIEDVTGVDYLDIVRFQRQPYARQLTSSGSDLSFDSITVNEDTIRDRWLITFDTTTTFSVEGASSGLQVNTGTVGTAYSIDDDSLTFTVTATLDPQVLEKWEIVTGPYIGNMDPDFDETGILAGYTFDMSFVGGQQ